MCMNRSKRQIAGTIQLAGLVAILAFVQPACTSRQPYPAPPFEGNDIVIDAARLPLERPVFYTYRSGAKNINFFVLRMQDKVLAFLDACATCYARRRGYRCEEGAVICRECNQRFSIYKLEKGIGGCYPIKLEGQLEKGRYRIPISALEARKDKF